MTSTENERIEPKVATLVVREKGSQTGVVVHGAQLVSGVRREIPRRGSKELLAAYAASPILQAVVRKIATTMACIEWKASVRGSDGTLIPVPNHIMGKLLNGGVGTLDGFQCKALEQHGMELIGESASLLERNAFGAAKSRWPIPGTWVREIPKPNSDFFVLSSQSRGAGIQVPKEEVLFFKDVDPVNPYGRGAGIARSLADELNADEAAAKYMGSSFANRARPDIIVSGSAEQPLSKEAAEKLHTIWNQRFGGAENAGKPFVSAVPVNVETLTPTFREMQMTQLREFERDILVTVFNIPPEILGIIENSNRATIDAADFLFMKGVIEPRAFARKAAIDHQLSWQYDERIEATYDDLVSEDMEFKQKVMQANPGDFSADERRKLAGEDALPEGAGAFSSHGLDNIREILADVTKGTVTEDLALELLTIAAPTAPKERLEQMIEQALLSEPPAPLDLTPNPDTTADDEESGGSNSPPAQPDPEDEPPLEAATTAAARKHLAPAAAVTKQFDIDEILDAIDEELLITVMVRNHRSSVATFSTEALESVGAQIVFDLDAPRVQAFLENVAGERSSLINGTTRRRLRRELTDGVAAGETTAKLQDKVMAVVTDAGAARAETIVRTEVVRASNFAAQEAFEQAGLTEKEWLAVQDDRVRETHAEMDGQRVPVDQPFRSPSGFEAMYPGDFGIAEEDINCRCVTVAVDTLPDKASREGFFQKTERERERLESVFRGQVAEVFLRQGRQVVRALEGAE